MSDDGFLSRWSRRKAQAKSGAPAPEPVASPAETQRTSVPVEAPAPGPAADPAAARAPLAARAPTPRAAGIAEVRGEGPVAALAPPAEPLPQAEPPAPTMEDVTALAPGDEISRFLNRGVDEGVKRAAVKKLFSDPRYNIMDGLDVYIDDYGQPDPIPMAMLRKMNQSKFLGLFAEEEAAEAQAAARKAATDPGAALRADPPDAAVASADTAPSSASAPNADAAAPTTAQTAPTQAPHEDPDLQLQPDDAARRPGAELGAGRGRG
jgi:hypothetical protein